MTDLVKGVYINPYTLKKMWDNEAVMSTQRNLGKTEGQLEIVQSMLEQGLDSNTIAKLTALPLELIQKAQKNMHS